MPYIAESTIREVNDKLDAVAVVGDYVRLEKRGGRYWGLCPFHNEKTPSFTVDQDRKTYYCFGCAAGGGVINFMMEMDKLSFPEAIETLARRMGIEIVYENSGSVQKDDGKAARLEELAELYRRVAVSFNHFLLKKPEGQGAKQYIISRGINTDMIDCFRLGYAPADRSWLYKFLSSKGYSAEFLASSGLFSKKNIRSAFFSDRLMFPIADRRGKTVAFGGRILSDGEPKYLNSGESESYKKRETFYAIDLALPAIRKTKEAYIAEGYMDVIALHQAGITNAVAPLGTAFTEDQAKLLRRWAERVYLIFDTDNAGQEAALKAIMTCRKNGLESFVVTMDSGSLPAGTPEASSDSEAAPPKGLKDPADILKKYGAEALQKSVKCFITDFEYLIKRGKSRFDLSDSLGKSKAAAFLFPYLKTMDSEVSRDSFIGEIADAIGVERQAIAADFRRFDLGQLVSGQNRPRMETREAGETAIRLLSLNDELFLLTAVSVNRDLYSTLRSALTIEDFEDPAAREFFIALEEWFRNDMPGTEDLLARIQNGALRNFVIQQGASRAFSVEDPGKLVNDGIRKVKVKRLERRLAKIVTELRIAENEKTREGVSSVQGRGDTLVEDLLVEKVHLDAELRRLKEAKE
ncbi:DNA primase [Treponema primitia ZAS-2]|uniref:DNA primase n=1 Tax=Treponema primitia (strain ATCC BAA-887 / DSM 12427 / ZAS-2) TaxID=545694 RepID=F5YHY6_TREPZ|nr:DNA primase [Treponema primitia]AEF83779.1 DNA primase [Treponema primitia ZAS-2]